MSKEEFKSLKKPMTPEEKELNELIKQFCRDNDIKKNGKTYTFQLGNTKYRVSNHKMSVTGVKNNFTRYETFEDSGKKKEIYVFIYDNEDNIVDIYTKLKNEYMDKLKKLLDKQGKDDGDA